VNARYRPVSGAEVCGDRRSSNAGLWGHSFPVLNCYESSAGLPFGGSVRGAVIAILVAQLKIRSLSRRGMSVCAIVDDLEGRFGTLSEKRKGLGRMCKQLQPRSQKFYDSLNKC
jgi:hypothetical protein